MPLPLPLPLPHSTPAQAQIWTVPGVADEFDRADRQTRSAKAGQAPNRCAPSDRPGEIVVCKTDPDAYRIPPADPLQAQSAKPLARLPLGENLTVETQARQTSVGGWTSKAIMATVRFGF